MVAKTSQGPGMADLLNYQTRITPEILIQKDGSFLTGWWFEGPDGESARNFELAQLSAGVNRALARLGSGWMIHVEALRSRSDRYLRGSQFVEVVDVWIDDERRANAGHFRTDFALFLTYLPSSWETAVSQNKLLSGLVRWLQGGGEEKARASLEKDLEAFEAEAKALAATLSTAGLRLRRMRGTPRNDELLQALEYAVNGRLHPVKCPPGGEGVDVLLARELARGEELIYGGQFVRVIGVRGYPLECFPAMLAGLNSIDCEYRWSNRFIFMDLQEALALLNANRRKWEQKQRTFLDQVMGKYGGKRDRHAMSMTWDIDAALEEVQGGYVGYGHHTCAVVLRASTRAALDAASKQVIRVFEANGFEAAPETLNQPESLLGTFPGHGAENVRKCVVNTLNLSDLLPLTREWTGERFCPCDFYPPQSPPLMQVRTRSGSAFALNLHVGDVGHTLVLGPTGAGKSTLLATLASQFQRYPKAQVFVFDKGYSMLPLTLARRGGAHYDLGAEDAKALCPLAVLDEESDLAWAAEWVETLLELNGVEMSPERRAVVQRGVRSLAKASKGEPASMRTMVQLAMSLQDEALKEAMTYYTEGPGARILNGAEDAIRFAPFTTFELEELMRMGPKITTPALLFIFRQIEKRLDGRPSLLIIDEAWLALSSPQFSGMIREWLKVFRKANCAVILATQSLADVVNSPIRDAILESCPTRILLANPEARLEGMRALYSHHLGLNERQIELIARARKKFDYFYAAGTKSRMFALDLGPVALSFVGASGKEDIRRVRELHGRHGPVWIERWLELRGVKPVEIGQAADEEKAA